MRDQWDRMIRYARFSLTNDCNLCCRYCREGRETEQEEAPVSGQEFRHICRLLGQCGISRFKLTGGEPLLRQDLAVLAEWLAGQSFTEEVTVTTNGTLLAKQAASLKRAGVSGVNVSLDTLRREAFRELTGRDCLEAVLDGIRAALEEGLRVRINAVAEEGFTEGELEAFLGLVRELPVDVRFISLMPVGPARTGARGLSGEAVRGAYERMGTLLRLESGRGGNGPAVYYSAAGCKGGFGFIDPLQEKFCGSCNRVRVCADGSLKPCLYDRERLDIRALLQEGASEDQLLQEIRNTIYRKPLCHHYERPDPRQDERSMDRIGG